MIQYRTIMAKSIISIKNLTKSFKSVDVLKGINLEVEEGTMLALLGPNGADGPFVSFIKK